VYQVLAYASLMKVHQRRHMLNRQPAQKLLCRLVILLQMVAGKGHIVPACGADNGAFFCQKIIAAGAQRRVNKVNEGFEHGGKCREIWLFGYLVMR
jgi:hypothetical protein